MNLVFRLILLFLRKFRPAAARHPLDTTEVEFWCLPHDCDFNMHITNSRYASFCDLARIGAMLDQGSLSKFLKQGYIPILTAQQIVNHKEIVPFRKFVVKSSILGWEERFWIFRHDFYQDGSLKATVLAKCVFTRRKKIVPFVKALEIAGYSLNSPVMPEYARDWSHQSDRLYHQLKRSPGY